MSSQERREIEDMFLAMGYRQPNKIIDMVQKVIWDDLREEFHRLLSEGNLEIWQDAIVMEKFDQAVRRMRAQ